jgi:hypothetical protein
MLIKAYLAQAVYSDIGTSVMTHFGNILRHRQLQRLHPSPGHRTDSLDCASTPTCRDGPSPAYSCRVPLPALSAAQHPMSTRYLQGPTPSQTIPALCHHQTPHPCAPKPEDMRAHEISATGESCSPPSQTSTPQIRPAARPLVDDLTVTRMPTFDLETSRAQAGATTATLPSLG